MFIQMVLSLMIMYSIGQMQDETDTCWQILQVLDEYIGDQNYAKIIQKINQNLNPQNQCYIYPVSNSTIEYCLDSTINATNYTITQRQWYNDFDNYLRQDQRVNTMVINSSVIQCSSDQVMYQGNCVSQQCIQKNLQRLKQLQNIQQQNSGTYMQINYLYQQANIIQAANGIIYSVNIQYLDEIQNQILGDPLNCLQWSIYANNNSYNINHTRINVDDSGVVLWPVQSYSYIQQQNYAQIQFNFTQADLNSGRCVYAGQYLYQCYFELAFILNNISQSSYFTSIYIDLNPTIKQNTLQTSFNQLQLLNLCNNSVSDNQSNCVFQVTVVSQLQFCRDINCTQISNENSGVLNINNYFYMKQSIVDPSFANHWEIDNVTINYNGAGFNLNLYDSQINIIQKQLGYNIYQLNIPIVCQNVTITALGILKKLIQNNRIMVQDNQILLTQASSNAKVVQNDQFQVISQEISPHTSYNQTILRQNIPQQLFNDCLHSYILLTILFALIS